MSVQDTFTIEGSVLEVTNKICNAFGLQAYFDDSGSKLIFTSARPRMASNEIIINVPYQKQYSDFDYSILTVNRYDRVFFDDEVSNANYKNAVTLSKNEFFNLDNVYTVIAKCTRESYFLNKRKKNIICLKVYM